MSSPPIKRSHSVSPEPQPKKTKARKTNGAGKPAGAGSKWTGDRLARLLDYIIGEGARAADLDKIADELGVTRSQIQDQLKPNRSNVRRAAVEAIKAKP